MFLVGLPPYSDASSLLLGFLSAALLLFAAVAFGVWLMSIAMLQHELWLEDRRRRRARDES